MASKPPKIRDFDIFFEFLFTSFFCLIKSRANCQNSAERNSKKYLNVFYRIIKKKIKAKISIKNKPQTFWWFGCHECVNFFVIKGKIKPHNYFKTDLEVNAGTKT